MAAKVGPPPILLPSPPPHRAADSQVYAFFSDYFNDLPFFFLGASRWLCTPESGKELAGGETRMGRVGEWAPGGEGLAGHWSLIGCLLILRCK